MKYGLPREEKPRKKWKIAFENELRCLQMQVCFLKDQLDEATKKIAEFTSPKQPDPFVLVQDFSRNGNPCFGSTRNETPCFVFSQNQNSWPQFPSDATTIFSTTNRSEPQCTTDLNGNRNQRPKLPLMGADGSLKPTQRNRFASSERPRYQSTWDYDQMTRKSVRLHSITCMPSYKDDKSFEELRHEDYVLKGIGFSNQIQRYKDSKLKCFTCSSNNWKHLKGKKSDGPASCNSHFEMVPWYLTPKLPKAPWPFGPSLISNESSNSSSSTSDSVATGSTDVQNKSKSENKHNIFVPAYNFQINTETKKCSSDGIKTKDGNLSSQVLFELQKMGEKISSINGQLSKMDTTLSDVSSRVSVMDSRLSAVDMFVTMQRFDKKWQGLETRLSGLETPSPAKVVISPMDESISKDSTTPLQKDTLIEGSYLKIEKDRKDSTYTEEIGNQKISESEKSFDTSLEISFKKDPESSMDTSDMNISDFVRSISCTDVTMASKSLKTSSSSDLSNLSGSSKLKLESAATIEMADLKANSDLIENSKSKSKSPSQKESRISDSGTVSSSAENNVNTSKEVINTEVVTQTNKDKCDDMSVRLEETKPVKDPDLLIKGSENSEKLSSDPLGVTAEKDSSATKKDNSDMGEIDKDTDVEFVIVEKSDVDEYLGINSNVCSPTEHCLGEGTSNCDFKVCNDITEYLEVNLGKKKNLVYEFGYEAKPGFSLEPEGTSGSHNENKSDENQGNKEEITSKDDSFQKFMTNLIERKSNDAKQSSPFVFFQKQDPKATDGSSVEKVRKNKKAVRCSRRLTMLCK